MTRSLKLVLVASAALLAGCTSLAPEHVRPTGAVPATLPTGGIYPPGTETADVSRIGWREFFTDERLRTVIGQGLENNRDLQLAAANVLQARARYGVQRADRLPTVGASASATYGDNGAGASASDLYSANVGVSAFELDLFGRVRNQSEAALQQYFATEEARRATRISLISEIANAWLALAADQDQLRLSQETLGAFAETRSLTQAQFRVGVASELEARQADTTYQAALNDIAVLKTRVAQDQNALNLLVGSPVPAELLPEGLGAGTATLTNLPAGVSSEVLLRRPDVIQAERLLLAESANIGAARAARFPTISLTAALGTISSALTGLFSAGNFSYSAGPGISFPLFDNGRGRNNVRLAEAQRQAAVATYERTIQVAFREVADALAERGTIGDQLGAQTARAESARVAARLSEARFRVGIESFLTVLDAQRTAYAAQQQLVATRLRRTSNLVELYRSLGGGLN
jgi:outer membrane protein, multidrug efflux system